MKQLPNNLKIRPATMDDLPLLRQLIADSVWTLQAHDYPEAVREAATRLVYGVDTQLVRDGTYFAVEAGSEIVACGGWSRRKTLFGGDQHAPTREPELLNSNRRCQDSRLLCAPGLGTPRHRQRTHPGLRAGGHRGRFPPVGDGIYVDWGGSVFRTWLP